jgi:GT2 family glycosyltransferase
MTPAVSVVIVNFNRCELLRACLKAVSMQTFRDMEVVVVDNGSADGSVEFLRAAESADSALEFPSSAEEGKAEAKPRLGWCCSRESISDQHHPGASRHPSSAEEGNLANIRVVFLPENRGFAGGCNAGILAARGRYIATLNNDAEPDPGWLAALVQGVESAPRVGMCASKILLHGDRRRIDKVGHLIYLDGLNHGRGSGEIDHGQYDTPCEVLFPDGAAALYRREMLDEIGLFDETFFAYGDDADLGLRGRLAGWTCRYVPTAVVYHIHSATAGEFSALKAFLIERNRLFVAVKLFPLRLLLLTPLFTSVRFLYHAYGALFLVGSSGQFAAKTSRSALAGAILRAYWSGFKHLTGMWRSRRRSRQACRTSNTQFVRLLWSHRIKLGKLTLAG